MKQCKTCQHWQLPDPPGHGLISEIIQPTDPDTMEPMAVTFEVGLCNSPHLMFCERPLKSHGATLVDGSQFFSKLLTGEDFGCVNHTHSG